jgi:hypothetical protein
MNDPATKKLEIKDNPMDQKTIEVKFPNTVTNSSIKFVRNLQKKESVGWDFIDHFESGSQSFFPTERNTKKR